MLLFVFLTSFKWMLLVNHNCGSGSPGLTRKWELVDIAGIAVYGLCQKAFLHKVYTNSDYMTESPNAIMYDIYIIQPVKSFNKIMYKSNELNMCGFIVNKCRG